MNAGIDKLLLTTRDYTVKNVSIFGQTINKPQNKTEEDIPIIAVHTGSGETGNEIIKANKLFYNVDGFYNVTINQHGMQLGFNPSKILHEYELSDIAQLKKVVKSIQQNMNKSGISFEPLTASISRIDLAKQQVTERNTKAYTPAFSFMKGKRMPGVQYETGYRWGNKQHENTIYDKSVESRLSFPNLLRNEVKFKSTKYCRKFTGLHNLGNIYDTTDEHLTSLYNEYLQKKLFSGKIESQMTFDFDGEVERLLCFKRAGRNALLKYLAATGANEIVKKGGTPEVIFKIMKEAGYKRNEIHKQRDFIKMLLSASDVREVDVLLLIHELKTMFAA